MPRLGYRWKAEIGHFPAVISARPAEQCFGAAATQFWRKLQEEEMQFTVYNDEVRPYDADRQGRRPDSAVVSEKRLELKSVLFRNENREFFVLERGVREEKDDGLEALLRAEVAMFPRHAAASGEIAGDGLQARV